MRLRLEQSRSGPPTVLVGSIYIHSRYDPVSEASRFIESLELPNHTDIFIILEPGLGYCIDFLKIASTKSKLLVIHATKEFKTIPGTYDSLAHGVWYPDDGVDIINFLEKEIPEGSVCQLLEWKASAGAFGETYQQLLNKVKQFLKLEAANNRTTSGFGKRWLKNVFKNLSLVQNAIYFTPGEIPVIVTGAGPSLEDSIPFIHKALQRGPLCIVAVASSVPALLAHHIVPSLSVATDGGTWAAFHLIDQFRRAGPVATNSSQALPFPLAVTLNATLCSQAAQVPQLLISDGSHWQTGLLQKMALPFIQLPQRGTVSATVIDLAMMLSTGPLYITGIDLAHNDIKTHARPYGLDFYIDKGANRLMPLYDLRYKRALIGANKEALSLYAVWFEKYFSDKLGRISVLGYKHPKFPDIPVSHEIYWPSKKEPSFYMVPRKKAFVHQYAKDYVSLLIQELQNSSEQMVLQKELSFLLSGNKSALSVPEIIKQLKDLCY